MSDFLTQTRRGIRRSSRIAAQPLLRITAPAKARVSAMIRIYNEEDWLYQSVSSMASLVDQLVLIDNLSDDRTPDIIKELAGKYGSKVKTLVYGHRIARPGSENAALMEAEPRSPRLLANYYNWCMARCDGQYILKWDADMVALDELKACVDAFRCSSKHVLQFNGLNVHPTEDRVVRSGTAVPAVAPFWKGVTQAEVGAEVRLFPRRFAHYYSDHIWEGLGTPYDQPSLTLTWDEPVYLHMQLRKKKPFANHSESPLHGEILMAIQAGAELTIGQRARMNKLDIEPAP